MTYLKKIIALLLVASYTLTPTAHAAEENVSIDTLTRSLDAISRYVARIAHTDATPALTNQELHSSIEEGVDWLIHAQEKNGHFRYEYAPYTDTYLSDDNIVRQAGALYALGEIARRSEHVGPSVTTAMERAIGYLEDTSREDMMGETRIRCITKTVSSMHCPLGATALALVGILAYVEAEPGAQEVYDDLIADYRAFILSAQKEEGGFRNLHSVGSTRLHNAESPFSNGEALLALVRLYMYEKDPIIKDAIDRAFTYLEKQPYDTALYLWIMAAVRDLHAIAPNQQYVTYAHDFTAWRIEDAERFSDPTRNYCAYAEGVASALTLITDSISREEYASYRNELNRRNAHHHALQITEHDTTRLIFDEKKPIIATLGNLTRARGGFLTGDHSPTQRIDYTQHCITGYAQTLVDLDKKEL